MKLPIQYVAGLFDGDGSFLVEVAIYYVVKGFRGVERLLEVKEVSRGWQSIYRVFTLHVINKNLETDMLLLVNGL
jgi:hypothetical protein